MCKKIAVLGDIILNNCTTICHPEITMSSSSNNNWKRYSRIENYVYPGSSMFIAEILRNLAKNKSNPYKDDYKVYSNEVLGYSTIENVNKTIEENYEKHPEIDEIIKKY